MCLLRFPSMFPRPGTEKESRTIGFLGLRRQRFLTLAWSIRYLIKRR